MCGRAAQTLSAVQAAAIEFRVIGNVSDHTDNNYHRDRVTSATTTTSTTSSKTVVQQEQHNKNNRDNINNATPDNINTSTGSIGSNTSRNEGNYNMSPGMDAIVFWVDHTKDTTTASTTSRATDGTTDHPKIQMKRMTWGLLSQNGTTSKPLEKGMNKHFTNLMYNARSDTLYEKVTFSTLCSKKQSCIIALDGYFEWKTEMGKKQPYFVYRNSKSSSSSDNQKQQPHSYLLLAGLWKRTMTGWSDQPIIDTFTILTTEVCPAIQWLHTRMPVLIWDPYLAHQWLCSPSSKMIHDQLVLQSQQTNTDQLQWHKVTTAMSSMKFRTIEAILPYKDKQQSVKSFFTKSVSSTATSSTIKTKEESDDEVVVVVSQDQIRNTTGKNTLEYKSEISEPRPNIASAHETSPTTPNHIFAKKRKVNEFNTNPVAMTTTTTTTMNKSPVKKLSPTPPSKSRIINTTNTRTIDSFFTPKSTRK